MCLNAIAPPVRLTQDLVVYKVIRTNNTSVYRNFQYQPFTDYGTNEKLPKSSQINVAFHAYLNFAEAYLKISNMQKDCYKIVSFVIPKGTWVVFGVNGGIASSAIHSLSLSPMLDRVPL